MSGHSKWNNIKRKKEKTDAQKAKVFTKVGREISVAVKEGGADPSVNGKLRDLISKAKSLNVPNENIERIIKKASTDEKDSYEEITYEGYGPNGVALIVECLTDNRNRTAADLRHYFDKFGGNLGTTGCVSFMFEPKGVLVIENEDLDEDQVMEDAVEAGADDVIFEEEAVMIYTASEDFSTVLSALENKKYRFVSAQVEQVPTNTVSLTDEESQVKMRKLLDALEDNDDVQEVWNNLENEDEF